MASVIINFYAHLALPVFFGCLIIKNRAFVKVMVKQIVFGKYIRLSFGCCFVDYSCGQLIPIMDVALLFRSTRSRRCSTSERINLRRLAAFGSKRNEPNPICGMGDDDKKSSWAVCLENEIIFHRRMDFAKHITRFFGETGAVSARRRLAGCTVGCAILYAGVPKVKKGHALRFQNHYFSHK